MTYSPKSNSNDQLTSDQNNALEGFRHWLEQANDGTPFVLSGYAGSGKTFLSIRFLKFVEALGLCWTAVAPTHKAVGVLRQALEVNELRTTWYLSTIHRLLRLKLKRKGDLELCEETDQTAQSLEPLDLVLIDESSMIDGTLLDIALKCAHPYKTRLVFVGDPAQLPPIGESISPVFSMKRAIKFNLTKVVRHKGPVLILANGIREGSIPCTAPPLIQAFENNLGLVAGLDEKSWLMTAMSALKSSSINDNPDEIRILCYTNRTLENLVPHARRAIHGELAEQFPVLPGEILISRNAVMAPASRDGSSSGENPDLVLGSNRELVVLDVKPEKCDLSDFGLVGSSDWSVPVIETLMAKVRAGQLELQLRLSPPVDSEARNLLEVTLKRLREEAKTAEKGEGRSLWRRFFLIRDAFASLGPASVLTVHRSQGSSFGEVFVASDVFWPKALTLRRQLVYVAVSRAKKRVWLAANRKNESSRSLWEEHFREQLSIK